MTDRYGEFQPGTLITYKMGKANPWPAVVISDADLPPNVLAVKPKNQQRNIAIQFFHTMEFYWAKKIQLVHLDPEEAQQITLGEATKNIGKKARLAYSAALSYIAHQELNDSDYEGSDESSKINSSGQAFAIPVDNDSTGSRIATEDWGSLDAGKNEQRKNKGSKTIRESKGHEEKNIDEEGGRTEEEGDIYTSEHTGLSQEEKNDMRQNGRKSNLKRKRSPGAEPSLTNISETKHYKDISLILKKQLPPQQNLSASRISSTHTSPRQSYDPNRRNMKHENSEKHFNENNDNYSNGHNAENDSEGGMRRGEERGVIIIAEEEDEDGEQEGNYEEDEEEEEEVAYEDIAARAVECIKTRIFEPVAKSHKTASTKAIVPKKKQKLIQFTPVVLTKEDILKLDICLTKLTALQPKRNATDATNIIKIVDNYRLIEKLTDLRNHFIKGEVVDVETMQFEDRADELLKFWWAVQHIQEFQ